MKTLKFNFANPFHGHTGINMPWLPDFARKILSLDNVESYLIVIPITNCQNGKYNTMRDWKVNHQFFVNPHDFDIKNQPW
jgi:hypothetical protein